jgi:hypothetical protein
MTPSAAPDSSSSSPQLGWWLIAAGVVMMAVAWFWQRDQMAMPSTAVRLPAQVVAIARKSQEIADRSEERWHAPRVRFKRPDGTVHTFLSEVWTHAELYQEGQQIHVLFDPASGRAIVDSPGSVYGAFLLLAGAGALVSVIGIARLARGGRRRLNAGR